jgi:hypothetical protein
MFPGKGPIRYNAMIHLLFVAKVFQAKDESDMGS